MESGPKRSKKWLDPGPSTANPSMCLPILAPILELNYQYLEKYWQFPPAKSNQNTKIQNNGPQKSGLFFTLISVGKHRNSSL